MTFMRSKLRKIDIWVLVFVLVIGCMLATLSVMRYRGYNASMLDLGNMAQAIWSVTQGRPLESTNRDGTLSQLAMHAQVIYFLFVPIYALFPSPVTLLIIQAFLFASAGFPLYALAHRNLQHKWASRFITLVYLFYPVAQTAVLFDFHGDTLAMPLLVYMLDAIDRQEWKSYSIWLVLALSCKFYVSVAVIGLAITLFLQGQRKVALWTAFISLIWGGITFFVLKRIFAPDIPTHLETSAQGYITNYFGHYRLLLQPDILIPRLVTGIIVIGPSLWLGWRGWRWFIPAAMTILPALSTIGVVAAYDYRYHHYAIAVPFLVRSILAGAESLRLQQKISEAGPRQGRNWLYEIAMQACIVLLITFILVDIPLNPQFWVGKPWWGLDSWAYGRTSRDGFIDQWLKEYVRPDIPLMTTGFIAPHVINRHILYTGLTPTPENIERFEARLEQVDIVVMDALFDSSTPADAGFQDSKASNTAVSGLTTGHPLPSRGGVLSNKELIAYLLLSPEFTLTEVQDGMMVFNRQADPDVTLISYNAEVLSDLSVSSNYLATFGGRIALVDYQIEHVVDNRYEFTFTWMALLELQDEGPYFAVSRLEGINNARIAHIATEVLLPTPEWPTSIPVREIFDVVLPENIESGIYPLYVGWYDSSHLYAAWTDERSRLGDEMMLTVINIP